METLPKFGPLRERYEREAQELFGWRFDIPAREIQTRAATVCECLYRFENPPFTQDEAEGTIARHYYGFTRKLSNGKTPGNDVTRRIAGGGQGLRRAIKDEARRRYELLSETERRELIEFVTQSESFRNDSRTLPDVTSFSTSIEFNPKRTRPCQTPQPKPMETSAARWIPSAPPTFTAK